MYIPRSFIVALLSAPFLAYAQGSGSDANPFNVGRNGIQATAGQPVTLSWKPTTDGTVSLILRSGASNDLASGEPIASNIPNSGSYTWNVPSSAVRGSDYTIEIVSDSDSSAVNYSPYFVLESSNTVASTTGGSSSMSMSTAPSTVSPSSTAASSSASSSDSMSSSSASMTGSSSASMTSSMSMDSTMTTSTMSGSSSSASSDAQTTGNDLVATMSASSTTSGNSGARATAMAGMGMLGAVALGALAL